MRGRSRRFPVEIQLAVIRCRSLGQIFFLQFSADAVPRRREGLGLKLQGRARLINFRYGGGAPPKGVTFLARRFIEENGAPNLDVPAIKGFLTCQGAPQFTFGEFLRRCVLVVFETS